jgi:hypothetical protein
LYGQLATLAQHDPADARFARFLELHLYRLAVDAASHTPPETIAWFKWYLALWSDSDKTLFDQQMATAWSTMQRVIPSLKDATVRPNSPGTSAPAPSKK